MIGKGTGNLQRAQNRLKPSAMSTRERNLSDGFQNVRKFETMLNLPKKVINTARDLMAQFEDKKAKTTQGTRSEAFALAILYFAGGVHGMGKPIKEIAGVTEVPEKEIRTHTKKIQKVIPEALTKAASPNDYVRIIVSDISGSMLLERFACEICDRVLDHQCNDACVSEFVNGKRPGTIAAAAILTAAKHAGEAVNSEDVALCAQIGVARAQDLGRTIQGHWSAMFEADGGSAEPLLKQLRELAEKTQAALAPSEVVNPNVFEGAEI